MPRRKNVLSDSLPYHITARCNNTEWFNVKPKVAWDIFSAFLNFVSRGLNAQIHSFVLMNNHYHLMLSTPQKNLPLIMNRLMTEVARGINDESGRENHVFGGQHRASIIRDGRYFQICTKYVYRNPVKAGIVDEVQYYPFSSLQGILGGSRLTFPVVSHPYFDNGELFSHSEDCLKWLNSPFHNEYESAIQKGLNRKVFEFSGRNKQTLRRLGLW